MRTIIVMITLAVLGLPLTYAAQTSNLPEHSKPLILAENKKTVRKPSSGMTMRKVKRLFGEPVKEMPSTGKPPITRWIYERFTVYFEGKYVIHSVKNRHPMPDNNST